MIGQIRKTVGEYQLIERLSENENSYIETWQAIKQGSGNDKYRVLILSKTKVLEIGGTETIISIKDAVGSVNCERILLPIELIESKNSFYIMGVQHPYSSLEILLQLSENMNGFSVSRTLKLLKDLLVAVIYLKTKGIYHGGITPKAVYINEDKLFLDGFLMSKEGRKVLWTSPIQFVAPEIHMRNQSDSRIDIWGVGMVAYHMLFGCSPWKQQIDDPYEAFQLWNNKTGANLFIPQKDEIIPDRLIEFFKGTIERDLQKRWTWEQLIPFLAELEASKISPIKIQPKFPSNGEIKSTISSGMDSSRIPHSPTPPKMQPQKLIHNPLLSEDSGPMPNQNPLLSGTNPSLQPKVKTDMQDRLTPGFKFVDSEAGNSCNEAGILSPNENKYSRSNQSEGQSPISANKPDTRNRNNENNGFEFIPTEKQSKLAPFYKEIIFETTKKIFEICSTISLKGQDSSIEMIFRLLLMVAVKLYLQVIKKLQNIEIVGILDATFSIAPKSAAITDKENEQQLLQGSKMKMMWRENIQYLMKKAIQSTISGDKEEEDMKSTQVIISEEQLREYGKKYLNRLFTKYLMKEEKFQSVELKKIDETIKEVYVMLHLTFESENHKISGYEDDVKLKIDKLKKEALFKLQSEV